MKQALVFTLLLMVAAGLSPDSPAADRATEAARYSDMGFAALEKGESAKARKLFTRALHLVPSLPSAHRGLGDLALEQRRFPDAVAEYQAERAGYPNAAAVPGASHCRIGLALLRSELWGEAIVAYELGVTADPDFAEAHHQLALAYWKAGRIVEAGRSLARARELGFEVHPALAGQLAGAADDPTSAPGAPGTTATDRGRLAFDTDVAAALADDDYFAALQTIDAFLATAPDVPDVLTLKADVLSRMGSHAQAEIDLVRVLELSPESFDAQYQMAALLRVTGRPLQALQGLRDLADHVEDVEQRAKLLLNIGHLERDTGNFGAAIAAFEQALVADSSLEPLLAPELANLYTQAAEAPATQE